MANAKLNNTFYALIYSNIVINESGNTKRSEDCIIFFYKFMLDMNHFKWRVKNDQLNSMGENYND